MGILRFLFKKNLCKAVFAIMLSIFCYTVQAQVSSVQFGKNRIQYRKYDWRFYQTDNFNVYFNQGGLELAKFVLQVAEEELGGIEGFTEMALQRRANIVLYNSYDDMQATNIGLSNDILDVGGTTKLVNNKMLIYFNGDHKELRRQIKEGIARILVDNRLFGENIGEIAGNATLLDLPKWLTDGYVAYSAENWSVPMDDQLKNAMLSGSYRTFYHFAFDKPTLAGHSFWRYIAENYKKENVSYFLYLSILYKNLNTASLRICKKKFKVVLREFMDKEADKYFKDIRGRKNYPKGTVDVTEYTNNNLDFYHFAANPVKRSYTYAVAEFRKGFYKVQLYENFVPTKVLVKNGVRVLKSQRNPNYPIMSWDPKGTRLAVVYWEADKIKLKVHDMLTGKISYNMVLPFDQVQDAQYYLDHKKLIISGVKNGHSDIFLFNVESGAVTALTNDVWDDMDGSFVAFPNKYGILFSSNRPSPNEPSNDKTLPGKDKYNVYMIDLDDKGGFRQITQLTKMKMGDARYPTQYNMSHFTFVSDENGVGNRYAGFFTTKAAGLDTLIFVGDEVLRNPADKELDSTLIAWERTEPDSIGFVAITKDSTYTFPVTNYQSSLLESRISGEKGQVSELTQQGEYKFLYRLRVDSLTLRRRNVNPKLTDYMRKEVANKKALEGKANIYNASAVDTSKKSTGFFETEFADEKTDSLDIAKKEAEVIEEKNTVLDRAKLYKYKLKFSNDKILAGITNNLLLNRYQPYAGGRGPIQLNNGNNISYTLSASLSEIMEDYRFVGGVKPGSNFKDNEYFLSFQNYRKRLDYGGSFYRAKNSNYAPGYKLQTSIYQANASWPFDIVKSVRLNIAFRNDKLVTLPNVDRTQLQAADQNMNNINFRLEYVYDNTLNPTQNIWNGLRYKLYIENFTESKKTAGFTRGSTFNFGFDARYYYPIYRHFIWAVRTAADVSWGNQKLIYYLGGTDGWLGPKFHNNNPPNPNVNYAYQGLANNLRGFYQNIANGNNAFVVNSELRLPIFSTLINKPINNAVLRNFQLVQFFDIGTAWNGKLSNIKRPTGRYGQQGPGNPIAVEIKSGGIGPFAGSYGFGARTTVAGYFVKADLGWEMKGIFRGKPLLQFSLGYDF